MPQVLIDGQPADTVPVADRGLNYGDGLFETIAVFHGAACLWQPHLERLAEGCRRLGMDMPDAALLDAEAKQLCRGVAQGVLKVLLTRGAGGRGYWPLPGVQSRRILSLHPWPDYPKTHWTSGIQLRWCDTPLGLNPQLAGIKHCNRLEQVLARSEWDDGDIAEGLMCDVRGQVIAGTMTNVFIVKAGKLYTPKLDQCGVAGIARAQVFAVSENLGLSCEQRDVSREQVMQADALFLSNALIGIWPVARLADKRFSSNDWPHEMMAQVMERVQRP